MKVLEIKKLQEETKKAVLKIEPYVNISFMENAIQFLSKKGLKHSFVNGKTYMGKEVIASPLKNASFDTYEVYDDIIEAVEWNLAYEVLNIVKMLERGVALK